MAKEPKANNDANAPFSDVTKGIGQGKKSSMRKIPQGSSEKWAREQGGGVGKATREHRASKRGEPKSLKDLKR